MSKKREYNQYEKQKMQEVAEAIGDYLTKFEADPAINIHRRGMAKYLNPSVQVSNHYVWIRYHSEVVGGLDLSLGQASQYLAWLKAGNVGTYYEMMGTTPAKYHFGFNPNAK